MSTPEARIFKIIQNFTDTMKKIRLFKAHLLIARSIFEKEAPTADGKSQQISTYEVLMRKMSLRADEQRAPKREREIENSESETRCIPYQINLDEYSSTADSDG